MSDMAKVMTPEFRVSFPAVFQPTSFEGQQPKYKINMMFPKGTNLDDMEKLAIAAVDKEWPDKAKRPTDMKTPFRDGDKEKPDWPEYADAIFVAATSKMKPGLVDANVQPIIKESEFYAGCYARATVTAYAYDKAGNRGVAFGLQNIQKIKDGEPFSGREKPEDEFDALESVEDAGSAGSVKVETDMFDQPIKADPDNVPF